jgi:adenine C2-methylase RlmN of 23S rRNA A2503 and tRNA A37
LPATSYRIFFSADYALSAGRINDKLNDDHQHIEMSSSTAAGTLQNTKWQSCIDACMNCAEACEFCATSSDLKEQDVKMM